VNNNKGGEGLGRLETEVGAGVYGINTVKIEKDCLFFENLKWLKTKETAEYLRTTPKQIRKWVYQGRLKAYKLFGKSLRFKKSDLDQLLEGGHKWE